MTSGGRSPDAPGTITYGSYALVLLVVAVLFAAVFPAYVTAESVYRVDVAAADHHLAEDGSELSVTLRIANPTGHAVEVKSLTSSARLHLYVDGTRYSEPTGTSVEGATVPAGGSATVTAIFTVRDRHHDRVREAIDSGSLVVTGQLASQVVRRDVEVSVSELEVDGDE